ncbi:MAG: hypothetical protein ISR65_19790 [Bacteriovoracaceae bacterium]|nr:hypothetical protein [Bacteriovoracaceae bacterium]
MENLDQRLLFIIKKIIEENSIPYAKAAKIGGINLLELEKIILKKSELDSETLTKVFKALDKHLSDQPE